MLGHRHILYQLAPWGPRALHKVGHYLSLQNQPAVSGTWHGARLLADSLWVTGSQRLVSMTEGTGLVESSRTSSQW